MSKELIEYAKLVAEMRLEQVYRPEEWEDSDQQKYLEDKVDDETERILNEQDESNLSERNGSDN